MDSSFLPYVLGYHWFILQFNAKSKFTVLTSCYNLLKMKKSLSVIKIFKGKVQRW